jgi:hypothetical protein
MNKLTKSLLALCLSFMLQNAFAQSKDEASIKEVIERETATWRAGDATGHADCWEIRPYSRVFVSLLDGTHIDVSPETMKKQSEVMGGGGSSINSNYKIAVNGNTAWANFDEETTTKDGVKGYSHEMRMLEKVYGKWKIVGESVHFYKPTK